MVFAVAIALFLSLNLFLKVRELRAEERLAYGEEEKPHKKKNPAKTQTEKKTKARPKEHVTAQELTERQDFYDADDKDIIDEFEEDPEIISSRKKKEKGARQKRQEYVDVAPMRARTKPQQTDDDDIEFLDLN